MSFIKEKIHQFNDTYQVTLTFFEQYIELRKNNFDMLKWLAQGLIEDQIEGRATEVEEVAENLTRAYLKLVKNGSEGQ